MIPEHIRDKFFYLLDKADNDPDRYERFIAQRAVTLLGAMIQCHLRSDPGSSELIGLLDNLRKSKQSDSSVSLDQPPSPTT